MTSRDFAYWLQGFFEISGESLETIQKPQLEQIQKHLAMVFVHEIDPSHGGPEEQAKLNAIHNPGGLTHMEAIQAHNATAKANGQPLMRC
ncbi:hypothetical protein [Hymenobacter ruber]